MRLSIFMLGRDTRTLSCMESDPELFDEDVSRRGRGAALSAAWPRRVRVLIVDDSALVRRLLERAFSSDAGLEVVGTASDPYEARDLLVELRPDVMTLAIEMPRVEGVSFLRKFMTVLPTPTIVLSPLVHDTSEVARRAREAGAVDVVQKPAQGVAAGQAQLMEELIARVKAAAKANVNARLEAPPRVRPFSRERPRELDSEIVIGIGASTGGVAALGRMLPQLPSWAPGVVIVQHMPAGFTRDFAKRLDGLCAVRVSEARHGDRVRRGHVLIAPGGEQHCEVRRTGGEYRVRLVAGPAISGHVPSVDALFESLARCVGKRAIGCLLSGMGADGARGLLSMRSQGAATFAQARESCAVWGMPAAADALGAVHRLVPLAEIVEALLDAAGEQKLRRDRAR